MPRTASPVGTSTCSHTQWQHGIVNGERVNGVPIQFLGLRVDGEPFQVLILEPLDVLVEFDLMPHMLIRFGYVEFFGFLD